MKKVYLLLSAIILCLSFISCESGLFNCKYVPVYDKYDENADFDSLWFTHSSSGYFKGIDPDSLEVKVSFGNPDTTAFCEVVKYINGKFYVVQNGAKDFLYLIPGSSIFVLDKNLDLTANIRCAKGASHLVQAGNRILADSSYMDVGGMMTVIDGTSDTSEQIINDLPGLVSNAGDNWTYNGNVYVTTTMNSLLNLQASVVIFDAETFERKETTSDFTSSEYSSIDANISFIIGNQLWFIYAFYPIVEIYDLDTRSLVKEIDYRKNIPLIENIKGGYYEDGTPTYKTYGHILANNKIYFLLNDLTMVSSNEDSEYEPNNDLLVSIDTESLEVSYISLNGRYTYSSLYFPENSTDYFLISDHETVDKIDLKTGSKIQSLSIRN